MYFADTVCKIFSQWDIQKECFNMPTAFAHCLMLVGSCRFLSMYKGCYFYSYLIQIQRFVTMEVKCVSAVILLMCLELLLLTVCSWESVRSNYLLGFLVGYAEIYISVYNFGFCHFSPDVLLITVCQKFWNCGQTNCSDVSSQCLLIQQHLSCL